MSELIDSIPVADEYPSAPELSAEQRSRIEAVKLRRRHRNLRDRFPKKFRYALPARVAVDAASLSWAKTDGFLIRGNVGIGKTYAAFALAKRYADQRWRIKQRFDPVRDFAWYMAVSVPLEVRATYGGKDGESEKEVIDRISRYELLIIDDLYSEDRVSDHAAAMLYTVIYNREMNGKKTIVTTNKTLKQINEIEARTASRLNAYRKIDLPDIDWRSRIASQINRKDNK